MLQLEINNLSETLEDPGSAAVKLLQRLEASGQFPIGEGELSVAFVDDSAIGRIHEAFMGDPTPTDVITFPADPSMETAGEIIVSVDHAQSRSMELGEPFTRELSLYLVHGWLHLAGYDDREPEDRQAMRDAEQRALQCVEQVKDPPQFRLKSSANR